MFRFIGVLLCFAVPAAAQDALRAEVIVAIERVGGIADGGFIQGRPIEGSHILSQDEARAEALEDAAYYFGSMIYGWSFHYEVGERARGIEERLVLTPLGSIAADDPRLEAQEFHLRDGNVHLWANYRPDQPQQLRLRRWRSGSILSAQGIGYAALESRHAALEDAARAAIRGLLQAHERNRPREAIGYIALAAFPRFWIDSGRWNAVGRFRVDIVEIIPFAVH